MKLVDIGCTLLGLAMAMALNSAPALGQQQAPRRSATQVATLVGCVEREADYRKRVNDGKGGALGTGIGVDNEYVLTDVRSAEAIEKNQEVGTNGVAAVYSVTGRLEKELKAQVGRPVEVLGFIEQAGAHGSEVTDLPRINVNVWHPAAGTCPK